MNKQISLYENIGLRIAEIRKSRGLTLQSLAISLGITKKHLQNLEKGTIKPDIPLLINISNTLNISLDYLIKGIVYTSNNSFLIRSEKNTNNIYPEFSSFEDCIETYNKTISNKTRNSNH